MSQYPMLKAIKLAQQDLQALYNRIMGLLETMEQHLAVEADDLTGDPNFEQGRADADPDAPDEGPGNPGFDDDWDFDEEED